MFLHLIFSKFASLFFVRRNHIARPDGFLVARLPWKFSLNKKNKNVPRAMRDTPPGGNVTTCHQSREQSGPQPSCVWMSEVENCRKRGKAGIPVLSPGIRCSSPVVSYILDLKAVDDTWHRACCQETRAADGVARGNVECF